MLYFSDITQDEACYSKQSIINIAKKQKLSEVEMFEAKIERKSDYFYCSKYKEAGEKGNCGKSCEFYTPRNGKSGMCKFNKPIYEQTDKKIIVKIKK
jgi:hypothetical protein